MTIWTEKKRLGFGSAIRKYQDQDGGGGGVVGAFPSKGAVSNEGTVLMKEYKGRENENKTKTKNTEPTKIKQKKMKI